MFTRVSQFIFMLCGLPVYCENQSDFIFIVWYLWRIIIVVRYNICLAFHTYRTITRGKLGMDLFGFVVVAVGAFVVNSLIGKHKKLIALQQKITADFNKKCYRMKPSEDRKLFILGIVFAVALGFLLALLARTVLVHENLDDFYILISPEFSVIYIIYISISNMMTTASNAMFYCNFCKHLKSMFYSVNKKVKSLQNSLKIKQKEDKILFSEPHCLLKEQKKVRKSAKQQFHRDELLLEKNSSVFPSSLKFCTDNFIENHKSVVNHENEASIDDHTNQIIFKPTGVFSLACEDQKSFINSAQETELFSQIFSGNRNKKRVDSTKHKSDHIIGKKIQNLTRRFMDVSTLVQDTDDIFSLQVLTILTISFARTCTYIYIYISSDWKNHDPYAAPAIAGQIFFDFLAFGSVAIQASLVTEEAKKFVPLMTRLPQVGGCKDIKSLLQSEVAAMTACATNVQLTAWKFFNVSRSFIPTVVGVTVTYVIVILQLYQVVQDSNCMERISNQ
ncbi:hypothetical protein AVEN_129902-1 [Araneus ventricosus]|uniref:Gustatory receptor n=1 Tax=Araneus ventricosus TaxID=182803 RepID=A0A4Y2A2D8_ARAVE|nr:hypothetical protein AVEN_129902-1 [Araneus ventricosus]